MGDLGNGVVAYSVEPLEIDHFVDKLKKTKKRMTDGDFEKLEQTLRKIAADLRRG